MRELESLCESVGPGGRIPRHTELMARYGVSQHHVIRSLEELQRQGRIVRKHGSGTFVTDVIKPVHRQSIVAIAQPDASYFDLCVEVLYDQAAQSGIELVCRFVGPSQLDDFDLSIHGATLGVVLFGLPLRGLAERLQARDQRVVLVATPLIGDSIQVPCVYGQHDRGGYLLGRHLIDLGHMHIGYCVSRNWERSLRSRGHEKASREVGPSGKRILRTVIDGQTVDSWIENPKLAVEYFKRPDSPTALVMWNDQVAMTMIAMLSRAGVSVPGDVSVVGYDCLAVGQRNHPSLTTIDPSVALQVAAAVEMITDPDGPKPGQSMIFAPTFVQGESTAAPR